MATTIVFKLGYTNMAIPYSAARAAALTDLMENSTRVNTDWHGNLSGACEPSDKELSFSVVRQEIPVYVAPTEDLEEEPENETPTE